MYRKTHVSVVADMTFRGIASLNQVGSTEWHNFGVGGTGEARSEGWRAGVVEEGQPVSLPTS